MSKLIKSRKRVVQYGEVFTPEHIVNAMLDLVKEETERVDSRFLEPACGTGNFLVAILSRKLNTVNKAYTSQEDREFYSVVALSSIYGIELLPDNLDTCRQRLYSLLTEDFNPTASQQWCDVVSHLLQTNLVNGDTLKMETTTGEPIVFPEWRFTENRYVTRRDFKYRDLVEQDNPAPLATYPPVYYLRLNELDMVYNSDIDFRDEV